MVQISKTRKDRICIKQEIQLLLSKVSRGVEEKRIAFSHSIQKAEHCGREFVCKVLPLL